MRATRAAAAGAALGHTRRQRTSAGAEHPWFKRAALEPQEHPCPVETSQQSLLVLALLVIGFMLIEPTGLRGVWLRLRRYFAAWPFRY